MFRDLIPALADRYHLVAPDYPGFGHSSMPPRDKFAYTFDNLAKTIDAFTEKLGLTKYVLYVQDYGALVGYRLAVYPSRISAQANPRRWRPSSVDPFQVNAARVGRIDRRIGEPPCARRCRRTDAPCIRRSQRAATA
jgi:pimeloyl-ACP methyl ester carboxylesterase